MSDVFWIPAGVAGASIVVKNSRFIGKAACTPSVADARAFIRETGAAEPGCTHVVYAYIIGHGNSVTHGMSDAGEPPGTAGRPLLEVLKGSDLGDIALVVVRYFGGIKLGTGGLVKAYTETAQETLKLLKRVRKVKRCCVELTLDYVLYNQLERMLSEFEVEVQSRDFGTDVHLKLLVPEMHYAQFAGRITGISAGKVHVIKGEGS